MWEREITQILNSVKCSKKIYYDDEGSGRTLKNKLKFYKILDIQLLMRFLLLQIET